MSEYTCENCGVPINPPTNDTVKEVVNKFGEHKQDDVLLCHACYSTFIRELNS